MKELYNRFGEKRGDQLRVWCPCDPSLKEILCITLYDLYGNPQIETSFQDVIDDIYFICPDFPLFYLFWGYMGVL